MKVLLRENVEKLGSRGDIVTVADGYARNFLLPRSLGVPATSVNFRQLDNEKARIAKLAQRERAALEAALARLEAVSCTIVAPAGPEGHLYGSVGARDIVEALKKENVEVEEKNIVIEAPLKEVGVYVIDVKFAPDLAAKTRVWIVAA